MITIARILILSLAFCSTLISVECGLQELSEKLYAVHATNIFPANGVAHAGWWREEELPENFPNFRCTLHFALGELVRPLGDDWMSWEEKRYAIVTPLKSLFPKLVNLNCYDTFIVGDFTFDLETVLVVPKGSDIGDFSFPVFEYDENSTLREAVDALVAIRGGWKVTMLGEDREDEYAPAMLGEININTQEWFQPILELYPHLSLGLRWDPHHGEAWRFGHTELLLRGLHNSFYVDLGALSIDDLHCCRERLQENYDVFFKIYLERSNLDDSSKAMIAEKLEMIDHWIQLIDHEVKCSIAA